MTNDSRSLSRAELTAGILKKVVVSTLAYAACLVVFTLTIGPLSPVPGLTGWLSFLYLPSVAAIILLYLSSAAGIVLTGRMAGPLSRSGMILALTSFVSVALLTQNAAPGWNSLALPLFLAGVAYAAVTLASPVAEMAKILTTAIFAVAAGLLALVAPAATGLPDSAAFGWILLYGFLVVAATTLPAVFAGHSNEYLAFVGGYFSRREIPWVLGAICVTFLAYSQYLRPVLVAAAPLGMLAVEWGIVVIVLISVGLRTLDFVRSVSQARKPGDLQTLVQRIAYDRGSLESAHAALDSFVEGGRKEGLIVYVSGIMLENKVPAKDVEDVVAVIVNYADEPEPAIALAWAAGDVRGKNRASRLALAGSLVSAAADAIDRGRASGFTTTARAPQGESQGLTEVRDHTGGM